MPPRWHSRGTRVTCPCAINIVVTGWWNYITRYSDVVNYYRGLIAIKKRFYEFRMKTAGEICDNISFTDLRYGTFIMHIKNFMLILNPLAEDIDVPI